MASATFSSLNVMRMFLAVALATIVFNTKYFQQVERLPFTRKSAVIFAHPTFHDEVASAFACLLHSLGYYVVVYIGNGLHIGPFMVPFSGKRQRSSSAFYGKCVSEWVTIRPNMKMFSGADVIIFVTYPMVVHDLSLDDYAFKLLSNVRKDIVENKAPSLGKSKKKLKGSLKLPLNYIHMYRPNVLYITHRSEEFIHKSLASLHSYVPLNCSTFLFLSEHSERSAREYIANSSDPFLLEHKSELHLSHLFPVFPIEYFAAQDDSIQSSFRLFKQDDQSALFGIQGNFGGKHKHRKDPRGVADCLRGIERGLPPGQLYNDSFNNQPPTNVNSIKVSLDVIGNILEPLHLGSFETGEIRYLDKLSSADFYTAISRVKFLLVGVAERAYFTTRATSSVPAALIARVPLVASRELLSLYPCLRDAPVHKSIAKETECESLHAASILPEDLYKLARIEIEECSDLLWQSARGQLRKYINK